MEGPLSQLREAVQAASGAVAGGNGGPRVAPTLERPKQADHGDFSSNIAKARQSNPDIWIGVGYPNEAIEIIRQFRSVNYLPKVFIHNGAAQDDFVKATGKDGVIDVSASRIQVLLGLRSTWFDVTESPGS